MAHLLRQRLAASSLVDASTIPLANYGKLSHA
jgi:hypothetical protein